MSESAQSISFKEIPKQSLKYKLQYIVAKIVIFIIEKIILLFIKNESFINPKQFAWTKNLEENVDVIERDFLKLWNENSFDNIDVTILSEEQRTSVEEGNWYTIPFYIWGAKFSVMEKLVPNTAKLLEGIPDITTAFFSILKPHSSIQPHYGVINGYMRYHLGIIVPKDYKSCALKVNDIEYNWQRGESMIFDHRHRHEAWNKSDEMRVVLLIDTIRPLPLPLKWFMKFFTRKLSKSPYAQNMLKHLEDLGHYSDVDYIFDK